MNSDKVKLSKYGYSILQIETAGSCNMKCAFCPYPIRADKDSILDSDIIYKLINSIDFNEEGFEFVQFSQFNEPLMDPRIFEFYKYCHNNNIKARCITNGLLLHSQETRQKFIDSNPDKVKISLQTLNKEKFAKQRGIEISTDRYFNILFKYLNEVKDSPKTQVSLDLACNFLHPIKKNLKKIAGISSEEPSIEDVPLRLKDDLLYFLDKLHDFDSSFSIQTTNIDKLLDVTSKSYDFRNPPSIKLADNISLCIKLFHYGRRISDWEAYKGPVSCTNPILGILADGSIAPCCLTYNSDLSLGNIKENTLIDILNAKAKWINDLRDFTPLKSETCQKCMGAPSKRGIIFKTLNSKISSIKENLANIKK